MLNLGKLHKNIPYKNDLTPYSITRTIMEEGQPDILFHWHTDMEVVYVHEGQAQFHIDNDYFNSEKGDIILIRPNALHSIHPIGRNYHFMDAINFHLDLLGYSTLDYASINYLQPLYNGQLDFDRVIKPHQQGYTEIRQLLIEAMEIGYNRENFFELELKSKLLSLLGLLFKHGYVHSKEQTRDAYRREEKIRTIIDYINAHYQEELTIDHLASLCNYSPTYFMNFFKKNLGVSCMDYLISYRLRKATELLQHSSLSILEIASEIGFTNLSNFNRQFKKAYYMTPSHYREEKRS
ncbi:AraC family transcriptional regulator [Streptococcus lactarius]|uniref:AraC family transcriptional regulator n=1 Tax=Streptococcus lactarius TaxID=684066 RepID=A0A9X1BCS2_9STRE|nr:AraC family transcriptional regulator [Streptococcus lactarius]MBK4779660.1 AraC family transcriptional regulator [Streptococcus lactarius]QUB38631.1 helix-turn-helix transcriptional regulator [Streptococcus lactarius]